MILLQRFISNQNVTIGAFRFLEYTWFSVERPWLNNKPNVSCIPDGDYFLEKADSPKFGECWKVLDVEDRTHILIHPANWPRDVEGCIGLGMSVLEGFEGVSKSKDAINQFEKLAEAYELIPIKITTEAFTGI